ncbi:protein of unknown function [Xenorhabdus bovienii]|uniref:Uncharacterized protein n=1 Tax=Xenorhabdus bovienii TaxID=40576 RepID=A0A0B6X641_XENBV|nr:protein of unknown function [Xenorhabdus bovienii]
MTRDDRVNRFNNQIRYSYDNLLGSSQLELDNEGQVISQEEYYPFGGTSIWAARNQTEANYKTIRYSGKERDETGLYYYGYRYYQPWAGRWLSADPAGTVDGLNLYLMVRNNPVTLTDNDGLAPSSNRNHNTFWFATLLLRRSDEGMSKFMRRGQKIARAIAGGLAIGGLAATIAVTAGLPFQSFWVLRLSDSELVLYWALMLAGSWKRPEDYLPVSYKDVPRSCKQRQVLPLPHLMVPRHKVLQ